MALPDLLALLQLRDAPAAARAHRELTLLLLGGGFGGGLSAGGGASAGLRDGPAAVDAGMAPWPGAGEGAAAACDADFGEALVLWALQGQLSADQAADAVAPGLLAATCSGLAAGEDPCGAAAGAARASAVQRLLADAGEAAAHAAALAAHAPLRSLLLSEPPALQRALWAPQAQAELAAVLGGGPARPWALPQRVTLQSLAAGALHVMLPGGTLLLQPAGPGFEAQTAPAAGAAPAGDLSWQLLPAAAAEPAAEQGPASPRAPEAASTLGLLAACGCARPGWLEGAAAVVGLLCDEAAFAEALRRQGASVKQVGGRRRRGSARPR